MDNGNGDGQNPDMETEESDKPKAAEMGGEPVKAAAMVDGTFDLTLYPELSNEKVGDLVHTSSVWRVTEVNKKKESENNDGDMPCCGIGRRNSVRMEMVRFGFEHGRKPRYGSGERFAELESELKARGAKDPGALAAYIGRKNEPSPGAFNRAAAAGRRRAS